jgi:two-component system response regulator PrrA
MRVLVMEDSRSLAKFLEKGLSEAGFQVVLAETIAIARETVATEDVDAMVLDRWLPDGDGVELVKEWRERGVDTPMIMLTSMSDLERRLEGLRAGADDYMAKPFSLQELVLRLNRLLNRRVSNKEVKVGNIRIDPTGHRTWVDEVEVFLTVTEFALLKLLAENKGRVCSTTELLEQVWGLRHDPGTNRVAVYIRHLRSKLGTGLIHTVRGIGYVLDPDR